MQAGIPHAPNAAPMVEPPARIAANGRRVVASVRSGMAGKDVVVMLGALSAALVCNWVRVAEGSSPAAAGRSPVEPMRDFEDRAHDGFFG